jgi:hypothetical protein
MVMLHDFGWCIDKTGQAVARQLRTYICLSMIRDWNGQWGSDRLDIEFADKSS